MLRITCKANVSCQKQQPLGFFNCNPHNSMLGDDKTSEVSPKITMWPIASNFLTSTCLANDLTATATVWLFSCKLHNSKQEGRQVQDTLESTAKEPKTPHLLCSLWAERGYSSLQEARRLWPQAALWQRGATPDYLRPDSCGLRQPFSKTRVVCLCTFHAKLKNFHS